MWAGAMELSLVLELFLRLVWYVIPSKSAP
jgi:hypothetical protein